MHKPQRRHPQGSEGYVRKGHCAEGYAYAYEFHCAPTLGVGFSTREVERIAIKRQLAKQYNVGANEKEDEASEIPEEEWIVVKEILAFMRKQLTHVQVKGERKNEVEM